ncbi:MAG: hypothetical protein JXA81_16330 [Sedimentisphaerales bacterium]|nr:hypothetical protein [Sedimentisphaerales bacterium]
MVSSKESSQFSDDLIFPKIFQTFRMSIQPTKLIITSIALAVICLAGWIMDFSKPVVTTTGTQIQLTELDVYMNMADSSELTSFIETWKEEGESVGVFSTLWHFSAKKFQGAVDSVLLIPDTKSVIEGVLNNITDFFKAIGWALLYHTVYCLVFFAIELAVMSIAGGAICRIAALQFARGEKPGLAEALRYSTKKFTSFFTAPLAPVGIIIFIGLFVLLIGLAGNIPRVGELIVGLGMPMALFAGSLLAVIVIGAVAGFNLMFPAVAYDGSDSFDAISRSFSYVYAKPWRMAIYTVIAAIYGSICYTFVRFFAFLSLWITRWLMQLSLWVDNSKEVNKLVAIWPKPEFRYLLGSSDTLTTNWTESVAAFLVYLFLLVVVGLVVSFIISFYFSANTIIYSLMRKMVDNTAFEDIYMQFDQAEAEPTVSELLPKEEPPSSESESKPGESSS